MTLDELPTEALAMLESMAKEQLHIDTLEARGRDSLDFHEVYGPSLRKILADAFARGVAYGRLTPMAIGDCSHAG